MTEGSLPLTLTIDAGNGEAPIPPEQWRCAVEGDRLIIELDGEPRGALRVRLACEPYYQMNLYNSAGIPAMPGSATIKL